MKFLLILIILLVVFLVWWRYFRIARPVVPPLTISPDDPLMNQAIAKAKATIAHFCELVARPHRGAHVKIPFVSSSGETEFLWAEILSLRDSQMEVRYLTPPVTHTGRLERLHTHAVSDLVDWQVEFESGRYEGGYTMRVMFIRGREQWGYLPPKMEAEEKKYE